MRWSRGRSTGHPATARIGECYPVSSRWTRHPDRAGVILTESPRGPGELAQIEATLARVAALVRDARTIVVRGRVAFLTPSNVAERRSAAALVTALSAAGEELPERFHARHPGIDWIALKTNGNFAAQGDLKAHQAVLWRVLELEFPRIARQLGIRVEAAPAARRRPLWKRN